MTVRVEGVSLQEYTDACAHMKKESARKWLKDNCRQKYLHHVDEDGKLYCLDEPTELEEIPFSWGQVQINRPNIYALTANDKSGFRWRCSK